MLGLLCGCGIATFSVGISQVSYWFPQQRQGSALAIYAGVGNLAPGMFSLLLPFAIATARPGGRLPGVADVPRRAARCSTPRCGRNAWYFQLRDAGRSRR